jgi:response regulator NasT
MRLAEQLRPDLVILDIVMPETDGLTAAEHIVEQELAAVLILTAFSHRDKVARATRAGVMAYLVKPFDKADLVPAIEVAVQRWNEARVLANESKNLTERLETRKLVERAKGVLRDRHGLSEEDAFRLIQRISMERGMPMRKVSERLLDGDVWNGRWLT